MLNFNYCVIEEVTLGFILCVQERQNSFDNLCINVTIMCYNWC